MEAHNNPPPPPVATGDPTPSVTAVAADGTVPPPPGVVVQACEEDKVERKKEVECAPKAILQEHAIIAITSSSTSLMLAIQLAYTSGPYANIDMLLWHGTALIKEQESQLSIGR